MRSLWLKGSHLKKSYNAKNHHPLLQNNEYTLRFLLLCLGFKLSSGILFRPEQFTDLSEECRRVSGRRPIRRILDENTSAAYLRVDPGNNVKKKYSSVNDVH
ncbi:Uncharacterized protein FKW44_021608, partial [Caligus rogercresseyi]